MKSRAFSLIEVLVAVSVIGIMASVAHLIIGEVANSAREQRMTSDIDTLNRAVAVYLSNDGDLSQADSVEDVVAKLKTTVASEKASQSIGLTSSLVDPRLSVRTRKGAKSQLSLAWNEKTQRFETKPSQTGEVTEFFLDENLAEAKPGTDERKGTLAYSEESAWIWDYEDRMPTLGVTGATPISLESVASLPTPPTSTPAPPSSGPTPPLASGPTPINTLAPPKTSLPPGVYPIFDYDLNLSLTDPNPAGTAKLVYAIDYGAWIDYSGNIIVPAGSTLSVQALALDDTWSDSRKNDYGFEASPAQLAPPRIIPSRENFGYFFGRTLSVNLVNPNPAGSSEIKYRINDGPWEAFSGPFDLSRADYPSGVTIEARAEAPDSLYWSPSSTSTRTLTVSALNLAGSTDGSFHDPLGSAAMVTNLTESGASSSSYFDWGDVVRREGDDTPLARSSMEFAGLSFAAIKEGERFQVGDLDYFNGTSYAWDAATGTMSTAAQVVSFGIAVAMNADGVSFGTTFDFDFELINTLNSGVPLDPWADADFVRISNSSASERLLIDGREYEFRLEFGETTDKGFATFDEFHILEWSSAASKLYGTFTEVIAAP